MNKVKILKSKPTQFIIVLFLAASIIATGAYAWSGFFGSASKETQQLIPEEVRLADYSGELGEIYVVNNAREPMLVRVKFLHFLAKDGKSVVKGAVVDDPSTWTLSPPEITEYYRPVFSRAVVNMDDWKQQDRPIGDYWVRDGNGWYYYAQTLNPGQSTRTLISEITTNQFKELVNDDYKTATYLQAVPKDKLEEMLSLDGSSFTKDGRELIEYLNDR